MKGGRGAGASAEDGRRTGAQREEGCCPELALGTLISDSGLQNCDNKFWGFKSPSLWCFVQQP